MQTEGKILRQLGQSRMERSNLLGEIERLLEMKPKCREFLQNPEFEEYFRLAVKRDVLTEKISTLGWVIE